MKNSIVLGGGCFWCLEATYQLVVGVKQATPGYAGGHTLNPTYYQVAGGSTGHAEVVRITFDAELIDLKDILDIFWIVHDPTTLNRQGHDIGSEYRSIILFEDAAQETIAKHSIRNASKLWEDPIVTELKKLDVFYEAEPEHHNYFRNHPEQAYCQIVINPKLAKLRANFTNKLIKE